jgi:DNA-binding CsgD family transcriptional regulator
MQMPSKQMAEFLGINVKSLEMTRYRLRKKLALKERSDLNQYLNNL